MIYVSEDKGTKIFATVWKVDKKEKYIDLQISTSEKNQDGEFVNSTWFPRVIGHAFNALKDTVKERDRICITKAKLSNERRQTEDGGYKSYFKFIILEASLVGQNDQTSTPATAGNKVETSDEEDCPW